MTGEIGDRPRSCSLRHLRESWTFSNTATIKKSLSSVFFNYLLST